MVKAMQPGSVILDMAVEQGGNCALSELGKTVTKHGVHIIGQANIPATVPTDSSALYARNVLDFLKLLFDKDGNFVMPAEDDIVTACLMATAGEIKRKN
jgi:NAD(P) transhydrogenase subunit alpha